MSKQVIRIALTTIFLFSGFVSASDVPRTLQVTGEGVSTAQPDLATVQTGVVTTAATTKEALAANNKAMENNLSVLKEHGIAAKDIQTSRLNVQAIYKRDARGQQLSEISAYRVTNQVRVKVRDLAKISTVLDALVQAGSNQLGGIHFGFADPAGVLDTARKLAMADALHRAKLYAGEADVPLGKVQSITEQSVQSPQPRFMAAQSDAMRGGVPVYALGDSGSPAKK